MKNPMEVLRLKEQELVKVKKEIDALRIAALLLSDESQNPEQQKKDLQHLLEMP